MPSTPRSPCIAVTCGDPGGIGPEVAAKALSALLPREDVEFLLLGPHSLWGEALTRWAPRVRLLADRSPGDPGRPPEGVTLLVPEGGAGERGGTPGGRIAMRALDAGIALAQAGIAQAIVTAPLAKARLPERDDAPGRWHGQTEILAARCDAEPLMAFWTGSLLVGVATDHIPLRNVPRSVTAVRVETCLRILNASLACLAGSGKPRLAVCGINPHAGEGGLMGDEEAGALAAGLASARAKGIVAGGPFAADALFSRASGNYDGILAMYHDQGLIGAKLLGGSSTVHLTLGLPFLRTSPDHGTAFDIAGKGEADPASMRAALDLAVRLAGVRPAADRLALEAALARREVLDLLDESWKRLMQGKGGKGS